MKPEEENLLLRDLSARLPYGVKVQTPKGVGHLNSINQTIFCTKVGVNIRATKRDTFMIEECKPYLHPIARMTDEDNSKWMKVLFNPEYSCSGDDWLLEHHFDIRHLIEKGLALEAPKDMYKDC